MIWLVCGGRDFSDQKFMNAELRKLVHKHGKPSLVVHGAARGADRMAGKWAEFHKIPIQAVAANWIRDGKAAGPIRNQLMLDTFEVYLVVAFPGGRGTADKMRRAKLELIEVIDIANDGSQD